jgi:hypothetical protein
MSDELKNEMPGGGPAPSVPARNPYIMNFCKVLVEKKGEGLPPEALKKLLSDMYRLFESLLGQNMVNALPEDIKAEYLRLADDLQNLNYEKIGAIFDTNIQDYQQIMKDTMKQFAEIFLRNKQFKPEDYPVTFEPA